MNEAIGMGLWLTFAALCFTGAAFGVEKAWQKGAFGLLGAGSIVLTALYWWKLLA